jgi:hypothetical protein
LGENGVRVLDFLDTIPVSDFDNLIIYFVQWILESYFDGNINKKHTYYERERGGRMRKIGAGLWRS